MMKKIGIVARDQTIIPEAKKIIEAHGFEYYQRNPALILTIGGDGTLLYSERLYPNIPKLPLRHQSICKKCAAFDLVHVVRCLKKRNYLIKEIPKLEVSYKKKKLQAMNDIIVRNKDQWSALRFSLLQDGKDLGTFIGDGIVAATSFGSTGYFFSITQQSFKKGIAIALNNVHNRKGKCIIPFRNQIQLKILREKALISADNNPSFLEADGIVSIYPKGIAKIISLHG